MGRHDEYLHGNDAGREPTRYPNRTKMSNVTGNSQNFAAERLEVLR
ncbi:hypothetical protein FRUB_09227 [Fimbriiglobus ruber]|uniref:Uncharacterized protein n=1 Tax=Fimbriiglobus ruber TaxID=1908690 RepID=A0A225DAH4_9BACT|nr:hypothetical protein FRUB_09227 [Fimbriiglobus ruber]